MNFNILIVDDEKDITDSLKRHFKMEDYKVFSTNDPLEAMDIINKNNIKIVISDIAMPELNGIDLLKNIKESNGIIQVIIITGYVTVSNLISCLRSGASDCVFKPFENLDELTHAVKEAEGKLEKWNTILKNNFNHKPGI